MNNILLYIEEHLEEELNNKRLSKIAGYSEYHFIRLFKAHTNETVREYVCRRRLIKATGDILAGARIIDVAFKYGWKSHSSFTKSFKREFGFSPSLLRIAVIELDCIGGHSYMNEIFLKNTKIGTDKESLLEILKEAIEKNGIEISEKQLMHHYHVACKVYEGKVRYSGEEYVTHPINVAILLTELGAESDTILAGMFCDALTKGNDINLQNELPVNVWSIVKQLDEPESDKAVLVKLAQRLHNMRTIEFMDESKKVIKAKETLEIYMPLARRLNIQKLTDELNNLVLKYNL